MSTTDSIGRSTIGLKEFEAAKAEMRREIEALQRERLRLDGTLHRLTQEGLPLWHNKVVQVQSLIANIDGDLTITDASLQTALDAHWRGDLPLACQMLRAGSARLADIRQAVMEPINEPSPSNVETGTPEPAAAPPAADDDTVLAPAGDDPAIADIPADPEGDLGQRCVDIRLVRAPLAEPAVAEGAPQPTPAEEPAAAARAAKPAQSPVAAPSDAPGPGPVAPAVAAPAATSPTETTDEEAMSEDDTGSMDRAPTRRLADQGHRRIRMPLCAAEGYGLNGGAITDPDKLVYADLVAHMDLGGVDAQGRKRKATRIVPRRWVERKARAVRVGMRSTDAVERSDRRLAAAGLISLQGGRGRAPEIKVFPLPRAGYIDVPVHLPWPQCDEQCRPRWGDDSALAFSALLLILRAVDWATGEVLHRSTQEPLAERWMIGDKAGRRFTTRATFHRGLAALVGPGPRSTKGSQPSMDARVAPERYLTIQPRFRTAEQTAPWRPAGAQLENLITIDWSQLEQADASWLSKRAPEPTSTGSTATTNATPAATTRPVASNSVTAPAQAEALASDEQDKAIRTVIRTVISTPRDDARRYLEERVGHTGATPDAATWLGIVVWNIETDYARVERGLRSHALHLTAGEWVALSAGLLQRRDGGWDARALASTLLRDSAAGVETPHACLRGRLTRLTRPDRVDPADRGHRGTHTSPVVAVPLVPDAPRDRAAAAQAEILERHMAHYDPANYTTEM